MGNGRQTWIYAMAMILLGVAIAVYLAFGPPALLARTELPEYCASCHVMEAEYDAWFHQGGHRRVRCVDCHLPHENFVSHYVWKGIDGMKDVVVFHSGMVPERIDLSAHGQQVTQANCIRCHSETVSMIGQERQCWDCHRRLRHRMSGSIATM